MSAKVNGDIVPLDHKLKSSDIVEILTQKGKKPSPDWLNFAITSNARNQIRNALKGTRHNLRIERKAHVELKIIAANRMDLLSDITGIISRSHVNVTRVQSEPRMGLQLVKIVCETNDKTKITKLIIKIKALKEVKRVDYRFV